jgi:hypothetical protein
MTSLADDRIDGDGGFAGLPIPDDQFALAPAYGYCMASIAVTPWQTE